MTVGELITILKNFDPELTVRYQTKVLNDDGDLVWYEVHGADSVKHIYVDKYEKNNGNKNYFKCEICVKIV